LCNPLAGRPGGVWIYRCGLAVRSSNRLYESALVHTPTRPAPLNVRSCASIRLVPSQYTST